MLWARARSRVTVVMGEANPDMTESMMRRLLGVFGLEHTRDLPKMVMDRALELIASYPDGADWKEDEATDAAGKQLDKEWAEKMGATTEAPDPDPEDVPW